MSLKIKILKIILFALREFDQQDNKIFNFTLNLLERQHIAYELGVTNVD